MSAEHHPERRCHHKYYYLSCADFDEMYDHANGCCEICKTPEADTKRGKLVIDHDPAYGFYAVRGLLCDRCNSLMRYCDAGRYDPRAYTYRVNSWLVRVLCARRLDNFPAPQIRAAQAHAARS